MKAPLLALTLWRPWAWAVARIPEDQNPKRIENRDYAPPSELHVGRYFALHAGQTWSGEAEAAMQAELGLRVPPEEEHPTGIVAVARLAGVVQASDSRWFSGPYGWVLDDVVAIEPVNCAGRKGVWVVPGHLAGEVRRRWAAVAGKLERVGGGEERASGTGRAPAPGPVELELWCPRCAARHVDEGEWATRPHHVHRCAACALEWNPFEGTPGELVPTAGVPDDGHAAAELRELAPEVPWPAVREDFEEAVGKLYELPGFDRHAVELTAMTWALAAFVRELAPRLAVRLLEGARRRRLEVVVAAARRGARAA